MFAQPSFDDFTSRIDLCLAEAHAAAKKSIKAIERKSNVEGLYYSGSRITRVFAGACEEFDKGVKAALAELNKVIALRVLDKEELRRIAYQRLHEFADSVKTLTKPDQLKELVPYKVIDDKLSKFDASLIYATRQFDVGFEHFPASGGPGMIKNNIQVEKNFGNIQQDTAGSFQIQAGHLNIVAALEALQSLEIELSKNQGKHDLSDLRADLSTIKAQLSKVEPSISILKEAAKSARGIAEGIFAGAMTNRAVQLLGDLFRALGIS